MKLNDYDFMEKKEVLAHHVDRDGDEKTLTLRVYMQINKILYEVHIKSMIEGDFCESFSDIRSAVDFFNKY